LVIRFESYSLIEEIHARPAGLLTALHFAFEKHDLLVMFTDSQAKKEFLLSQEARQGMHILREGIMLEAIGLVLAVIDFFDLTPKLEAWLDKAVAMLKLFTKGLQRFVSWVSLGRVDKVDKQAVAERTEKPQGLMVADVVSFVTCGALAAVPSFHSLHRALSDYFRGRDIGVLIHALCIAIVEFVADYCVALMIIFLCATAMFYLVFIPLRRILGLMERAPRGVVGSIGLILAVTGFLKKVFLR
jgi:hypothetical protein